VRDVEHEPIAAKTSRNDGRWYGSGDDGLARVHAPIPDPLDHAADELAWLPVESLRSLGSNGY
jgi:hypothetical protein